MAKKELVIIGNGMATSRLLDELLERGARQRYAITVFGEERGGAYNRILLNRILAGEKPDAIDLKPAGWYEEKGIKLVSKDPVVRLDTAPRILHSANGYKKRYDLAVLATGSTPLVPPIEGMTHPDGSRKQGIFVYRTMDDSLRLRAAVRPGDTAVVLGGGLLGLEAAKALSDLGLHVTVLHLPATLMNLQLDAQGGAMLKQHIERCGIFVRTGCTVRSIIGAESVEGVRLDDGKVLAADLLVLACGVRPRIDLAVASEIPTKRGVLVNDALATQAPGVYAVGECAEHEGTTYGIVAPIWEQVNVLADVLSGTNPQARYRGSKLYARLKVAGVEVASMGTTEPELDTDEVLQVVETRKQTYRKLIVRGGKLVGAMLVGDTDAAASLVQFFDRDEPLPANRLEVLCESAVAGAGRPDAVGRTICTCKKVAKTTIVEAIVAGACSAEQLGEATGAGTGCGSCKPELMQLIAVHSPKKKTEHALDLAKAV
jgi:nitrite reductase (NADH) large subunit